jgi:hypothetical protein
MLMKKNWVFEGKFNEKYTFELYSKSAEIPEVGGIYILTYAHPRGHLAGYQINILCMGATESQNVAVSDLQQQECLLKQCWNYNYILCLDEQDTRDEYLKDLLKNNPICC